jgi:predicted kinase
VPGSDLDVPEKLLVLGSDVILDDGYFRREHRRTVVDAAVALGAAAKIHFIDTPLHGGAAGPFAMRSEGLRPST